MSPPEIKVILIGGPSGAGKTTLGAALATRLGIASLTVDDLVVAARAVTTPMTHPGLWAMSRVPWPEYFTDSSLEELKADATRRHQATWPMVKAVIEKHASAGGTAVVIDGWRVRPSYVADLVEAEATELGNSLLRQPGGATVDELCDRVLRDLGPCAARSMISPS